MGSRSGTFLPPRVDECGGSGVVKPNSESQRHVGRCQRNLCSIVRNGPHLVFVSALVQRARWLFYQSLIVSVCLLSVRACTDAYSNILGNSLQASGEEESLVSAVEKYKQAGGIAAGDAAAAAAQSNEESQLDGVDVHHCPMISQLFVNTIEQYARGDGWRPDLGWHATGKTSEPRNLFDTR